MDNFGNQKEKVGVKYNKVYVVTYWDNGVEPVVTVFDNQENAEKCYLFFKGKHDGCCVDEVPIYSNFGVNNKGLICNENF